MSSNLQLLLWEEADNTVGSGEKLGAGQGVGPCASDLHDFVASLPRNLHLDKEKKRRKERQERHDEVNNSSDIALANRLATSAIAEVDEHSDEEERGAGSGTVDGMGKNGEDGEEKHEDGLIIAWQYRQSVQRERLGVVGSSSMKAKVSQSIDNTFCHSYDLASRMADQHPHGWPWRQDKEIGSNHRVLVANCAESGDIRNSRESGFHLYRRLLDHILHEIQAGEIVQGASTAVRLLLIDAPVVAAAVAIPILLAYVRAHSLPVAVMITVRPWTCTDAARRRHRISLRRSCDAILETQSFASVRDYHLGKAPPEFRDLAGILTIAKAALFSGAAGHFADGTTSRRPPADRYGLRRDRKKLNIRMLHLPPEDFSMGGSSVSGGGVRSGAGQKNEDSGKKTQVGCGSTGPGDTSLDF